MSGVRSGRTRLVRDRPDSTWVLVGPPKYQQRMKSW